MNEAPSEFEVPGFEIRGWKIGNFELRTPNFEPFTSNLERRTWNRTLIPAIIAAAVLSSAIGLAAVPPQGQVEGEVIQVFSTVIVIRNEQGHATVLQLTPRTQLGGQFKPGDKVVAYVTPYGVSSVQLKANTAQIP